MVSSLAPARQSRGVLGTLVTSMLIVQAAAFAPSLPASLGRPALLAARRTVGLQVQLHARITAQRFSPRIGSAWHMRSFRSGTSLQMAEAGEAVGDKVRPSHRSRKAIRIAQRKTLGRARCRNQAGLLRFCGSRQHECDGQAARPAARGSSGPHTMIRWRASRFARSLARTADAARR